ncbi:MAG: ankyrin repeat domain-containing protein [Parachlamydiaceae bacterium]|nr:ankyrin repeat domain-containing protein [Parachlamydiaceae bacterium]
MKNSIERDLRRGNVENIQQILLLGNEILEKIIAEAFLVRPHLFNKIYSQDQLKKIINGSRFFNINLELLKVEEEFLDPTVIKKMTIGQLKKVFAEMPIEAKNTYVFYLLSCNRGDFIIEMLEQQMIREDIADREHTPLIFHALKDKKLFECLLKITGDVNVSRSKDRRSLLSLAIEKNLPIVSELISNPKIDLNHREFSGKTPIFYTIWPHENFELFTQLKSKGADLNIPFNEDKDSYSLLSKVCRDFPSEKIKKYIDAGMDPNIGKPLPLFWSIENRDLKTIKALMDKDANPFLQTLLFLTMEDDGEGFIKEVQTILESKTFNFNFVDKDGTTPLICAIFIGNLNFIKILIERGAKLPTYLTSNAESMIEEGIIELYETHNIECAKFLKQNSSQRFLNSCIRRQFGNFL